jgi:hypothetical protein
VYQAPVLGWDARKRRRDRNEEEIAAYISHYKRSLRVKLRTSVLLPMLGCLIGKKLWKRYLGLQVAAAPITYTVDGAQYVSIAAGHAIFTFGLPSH